LEFKGLSRGMAGGGCRGSLKDSVRRHTLQEGLTRDFEGPFFNLRSLWMNFYPQMTQISAD